MKKNPFAARHKTMRGGEKTTYNIIFNFIALNISLPSTRRGSVVTITLIAIYARVYILTYIYIYILTVLVQFLFFFFLYISFQWRHHRHKRFHIAVECYFYSSRQNDDGIRVPCTHACIYICHPGYRRAIKNNPIGDKRPL